MERSAKEPENLWNELLAKTAKLEDKDGHIVVIGNYDSAKRSLVNAVTKVLGDRVIIESRNESSVMFSMKDKKNPGAFDYSYVSIRNPADETIELAKLNFWILNEKVSDEVLNQIFTDRRLKHFLVMVVLDFEKVHTLPDDLIKWFTYINQKIVTAFRVFDLKDMDSFRTKLTDLVTNYIEPVKTPEGKILNRKVDVDPEAADKLIIPEGVLNPNYGFPIILCMNKSDYILELRKERHPDEILEMVEYTLRKNAFPYAASVAYTSPKMGTNINVLADYLKYLFFQIPFGQPYNPAKDSLFIPIGYDNAAIVNAAFGNVSQKIYNEVVPRKDEQKRTDQREFAVKPNQKFLEELRQMAPMVVPQNQANRNPATGAGGAPGAGAGGATGAQQLKFTREHRDRIMNVLNRNPGTAPAGGAGAGPAPGPAQGQTPTHSSAETQPGA